MRNSPLVNVLLVMTAISALLSVFLCWSYISNARQFRTLQAAATITSQRGQFLNALATDAVEYGKSNAAINPLLEQMGVRPPSAATKPPASAPKATK